MNHNMMWFVICNLCTTIIQYNVQMIPNNADANVTTLALIKIKQILLMLDIKVIHPQRMFYFTVISKNSCEMPGSFKSHESLFLIKQNT